MPLDKQERGAGKDSTSGEVKRLLLNTSDRMFCCGCLYVRRIKYNYVVWRNKTTFIIKAISLCFASRKKKQINGGFVRDGIQWRKKGI